MVGAEDVGGDGRGLGATGDLERCLRTERGERRGGHAVDARPVRGQLVDAGDAGVHQLAALRHPHPGDEQQVGGGVDLLAADIAAAAGEHVRHPPLSRRLGSLVSVQQVQHAPPALPEHRGQVAQREPDLTAVAEQQLDVVGQRDPGCHELIGVRRELEQSLRPFVAGELGVADAVGVAVADEEVGEPVEPPVEERRLADQVGAGLERREGIVATLSQERGRVGLGVVDEAD